MELDYKKLKLNCGLECHQQLDTSKLFCNCPSILRAEEPDIIVGRKLHAVAGEEGSIDIAADYEHKREREFLYQGYSDTTCEVEVDECPPREINQEALKIALQISLLLNAKPLEIMQIMRKTVIDGSNTSGFQRTLLIAKDGWIETSQGKIGIQNICLEEDAARIISQSEKEVTYRLDRLGIPLVEIATAPEIKTPEQAKEVALHIGEILRACKVKRGIGTIRQDVNLSISGGKRIEIKGVQEPALISKTIEKEVERQIQLVKEKKGSRKKGMLEVSEPAGGSNAEVRKANADGTTSYLRPLPGKARMYPETDLPLVRISRELINEVKSTLPKLKHELKAELQAHGLNPELTKLILQENKLGEYKELLSIHNNPDLIAKLLLLYPKEIASHEKLSMNEINKKITIDIKEEILQAVKDKKISESQVKQILEEIVKGKSIQKALKKEKIPASKIEEEIQKLLKEKPNLTINAYMGLAMQKFKGISGREIIEILRKYVK